MMLAPAPVTLALPGIGGRLRARPEDFRVDEIAAYEADGRPDRHLLVRFEKRGLSTPAAVEILARATEVPRREIGVAGRKDEIAVTRQWISMPAAAAAALERFEHPAITVLQIEPHGQKLRMGHLRGNRFEIVVRDLAVEVDPALERAHAKLTALRDHGGLENLYGAQRFGVGGRNLDSGLRALRSPRLGAAQIFVASAAQSAVFNLGLVMRREQGWLRTVLLGDVVRTARGGLFVVDDVEDAQRRFDSGEIELTGPLPGAKNRQPAEGSPAAAFEDAVLARAGLDAAQLKRHGKRLPGARRPLQLRLDALDLSIDVADPVADLGSGLRLCFTLPAGSFATQLLRELQVGPDTADPLDALLAHALDGDQDPS